MVNVAILAGGFDSERIISLKSAQVVKKNLVSSKYNPIIIDIQTDCWVSEDGHHIDKNDFSLNTPTGKVTFEVCFMAIHGSPVEDGKIQGYLEMLGIPYTGCDGKTMSITMDKILTKQILKNTFGIRTASFEIYTQGDNIDPSSFEQLGYPMFIKPNSVGSSFGVTKVKSSQQVRQAIEDALEHDKKVLIEEFIEGREFSHGVLQEGDKLHIMPITEIIPETEFFDYAAKYEGKSKEVTPAENLSEDIENEIKLTSEKIFRSLNCKGLARIDYLVRGTEVFFMEVNTIPGLSEASIFPQQLKYYGFTLEQSFDIMLTQAMSAK